MLTVSNLHFTTGGTTRIAVGESPATVNVLSVIVDSANVIYMNPSRTVFNTPVNVGAAVAVTGNLYKAGDTYRHGHVLSEANIAPALMFGGANTGITYSALQAVAIIEPDMVHVVCRVVLTSKGTATGSATLRFYNLPVMMVGGNGYAPAWIGWWSGMAANTVSMTGLTTANSSFAEIRISMGGNVATNAATQVHFSNTSNFTYATSYAR